MSKEFGQIEQKVAEYEMARQELGKIDYDEKIEQIKNNLIAEMLLDFLKVEDKLIDQSGSLRAIIRSELYKLFYEKVDTEHSVDYEAIAQGLSRSQKVCDFFWGTTEPRIVDQLSTESLTGAIAIKKSMEGNVFKEAFHRMYFIPPLDRIDAFNMIVKLVDINLKVFLPTDNDGFQDVRSQPRPDHLYSLSIEPVKMNSLVYSKNRNFNDVAQSLKEDNMCGLTIQEYLFWLADRDVKVEEPGELQTILFDERFSDLTLLESRWEDQILKIRPTRNYNSLVPILALKGWGNLEQ